MKADIATFDKSNLDFSSDSNSVKDRASNRSTNTKAARFQHTSKALAFVLLSNGRLRHCAQTLCESPADAHGLEIEELKRLPAPLLTGDGSISKWFHRGVGTVARATISTPRHAPPLRDRDGAAPVTFDGSALSDLFVGPFA